MARMDRLSSPSSAQKHTPPAVDAPGTGAPPSGLLRRSRTCSRASSSDPVHVPMARVTYRSWRRLSRVQYSWEEPQPSSLSTSSPVAKPAGLGVRARGLPEASSESRGSSPNPRPGGGYDGSHPDGPPPPATCSTGSLSTTTSVEAGSQWVGLSTRSTSLLSRHAPCHHTPVCQQRSLGQ